MGLVDVFNDDDAGGGACGKAGELSLLAPVFPAWVSATDFRYELLHGEAAHVEDVRLSTAE